MVYIFKLLHHLNKIFMIIQCWLYIDITQISYWTPIVLFKNILNRILFSRLKAHLIFNHKLAQVCIAHKWKWFSSAFATWQKSFLTVVNHLKVLSSNWSWKQNYFFQMAGITHSILLPDLLIVLVAFSNFKST